MSYVEWGRNIYCAQWGQLYCAQWGQYIYFALVRFHSTPTGMRPENWQGEPPQSEFQAKASL